MSRIVVLAEKTFANGDKAQRWLHRKLRVLNNQTPMEPMRTDAGARVVENLLARISWGASA